jgi:hypothetical protein
VNSKYFVPLLTRMESEYIFYPNPRMLLRVKEPHHFYAALATGNKFEAALAAPVPTTTVYSNPKFSYKKS